MAEEPLLENEYGPDAEIRLWPRLSFYYPSLSFFDLAFMPRWAVQLYLDALPTLLAEQQIRGIQIAAFPHLDPKDGDAMLRRLMAEVDDGERTTPGQRADAKSFETQEEFIEGMAAIGFPVIFEPKDGE